MKLYTYPGAPNPRRVHVYLAEKGLEIPTERIDIMKRANREPEFLDKNPYGGIPVLELDDGSHLAESVAICRYLEALHPAPPLFGRSAREQGEVEMWIRRAELGLMVPLGMVWAHGSPLTARIVKQIPALAEQYRGVVARAFETLDRAMGERPFLAGDAYSMADIVLLSGVDFARDLLQIEAQAELKNVKRWHAAVSARPSAAAGRAEAPITG